MHQSLLVSQVAETRLFHVCSPFLNSYEKERYIDRQGNGVSFHRREVSVSHELSLVLKPLEAGIP